MTAPTFAPSHRWDRWFMLAFLLGSYASIYFGFESSVTARMAGKADYPAPMVLQLHVFAFAAWMVGLAVQVALIRSGRPALHRLTGFGMLALVPVMVATAIGAEAASQHFYTPKYPENIRFFIEPVVQMLVFAVCIVIGWLKRRDAAAHRRCMLLGTSAALVAAYNRWFGEELYALYGDGFWGMIVHNYAGPDGLMLILMAWDFVTRRRIHRVYLVGVPLILASQITASAIYHSDAWPGVARALLGL
jgi:hypothetical protein